MALACNSNRTFVGVTHMHSKTKNIFYSKKRSEQLKKGHCWYIYENNNVNTDRYDKLINTTLK